MDLPEFITHYFEEERGPFRNICDLSGPELDRLARQERDATTAFNRFSLGADFWKLRRLADDLLIAAYSEKFGRRPEQRPFYAVLGQFDRTLTMYRRGASVQLPLSKFLEEDITFTYPDHFCFAYRAHQELQPEGYFPKPFHGRLFTRSELPAAVKEFNLDRLMEKAQASGAWVSSYVEAHLWLKPED